VFDLWITKLSSNPQRHVRTSLHIMGNLEVITKVQVFLFCVKRVLEKELWEFSRELKINKVLATVLSDSEFMSEKIL
jgi:hypothetical protein